MKTVGYPLRLIGVIVLFAGAIFAAGWLFLLHAGHESHDPHNSETYQHMIDRFRSQADEAVRQSCKKNIPRIRDVTSVQTHISDNNCEKWTADATAEYYNPDGGIELTNMHFVFTDTSKTLQCINIPGWY